MLIEMKDKLSGKQDEGEDSPHTFEGANTDIFHIQALLLVKTIAVFDTSAQTPVVVNLLSHTLGSDGDIGQQDQSALFEVIFGDQYPQLLMSIRQTDFEPAQFDLCQAAASSMLEDGLAGDLPEDTIYQVAQVFCFLALQARVVDFHQTLQVRGGNNELIRLQKGEEFLIIPSRIHHETQLLTWKDPAGGANRALDFSILAEEVSRLVREPIRIRNGWRPRVDHCGGHSWITMRQTGFAFQVGRRTLCTVLPPSSFFVYGFSKLTGSNATTR